MLLHEELTLYLVPDARIVLYRNRKTELSWWDQSYPKTFARKRKYMFSQNLVYDIYILVPQANPSKCRLGQTLVFFVSLMVKGLLLDVNDLSDKFLLLQPLANLL